MVDCKQGCITIYDCKSRMGDWRRDYNMTESLFIQTVKEWKEVRRRQNHK